MASPTRSRSRSPARDPAEPRQKKQKKFKGGLKFKEKKQPIEDNATTSQAAALNSKYRERSPLGRRNRDRDAKDADAPVTMNDQREALLAKSKATEGEDPTATNNISTPDPTQAKPSNDIASKFGASAAAKFANYKSRATPSNSSTGSASRAATAGSSEPPKPTSIPAEEKPPKETKKRVVPNEPIMLVTVNDRLGTKTSVPCLGSDTIKVFKSLVASKIGRKPHEIMIKRQSERPFRDQLTLADYSVSHGVQLDLEIDTGD